MKKHLPLIIILALILATTTFAASNTKTAQLYYNNIKVSLNGASIPLNGNNEPFIIDGTTYLPVRAISEALNLQVDWDASSNTVRLTTSDYAQVKRGYNRSSPAPIGVTQEFKDSWFLNDYTGTATVNYIKRGEEVEQMVLEENYFNDPPEEGMEYILANITVSIKTTQKEGSVDINHYSFDCFSNAEVKYSTPSVVAPSALSASMYSGGTATGNVIFEVSKNDPMPKIAIGRSGFAGYGGTWFALY